MATALSAVPQIDNLLDFTIVYKSDKKSAWSFLKGEMRHVKVLVKQYQIPKSLKN